MNVKVSFVVPQLVFSLSFGKYCSLCNVAGPSRAPHVGLDLLLLKLFLV